MQKELDPKYGRTPASLRKAVPRARGYPIVGLLPGLVRDAPNLFRRIAQEHRGAVVELNLVATRIFLVTHPEQAQYVLTDNWRNFTKDSEMWTAVRRLLGNGLVTSGGDEWLRNRRLVQPLFSPNHLSSLVDLMGSVVAEDVAGLEAQARQGAVVDMDKVMMALTQRVILATMFGTSITSRETETLGAAILAAFQSINTRMLLHFLPARILPGERALKGAIARIDEVILHIVRERRKDPGTKRSDFLSLLLQARDEAGSGMDDQQVRDELVTMFVAGNETTAVTMTWLLYLLDEHPAIEQRIRAEIDAVVGDRLPTADDLARMEYTKMVIQETMRMYPPSWILPRMAKEDDVICGYPVSAGSTVIVSQYAMHHDPELWESPSVFDPERFTPERSTSRPRYAFLPFGAGPRQCLGNLFSIMEAQIIVALMLRRLRARRVPGHPVSPQAVTTLRPRHGLKMTLERIDPRDPASNQIWAS